MKNINFAIIGFGSIARTHVIGAYAANLQFELPYTIKLKSIVSRRLIGGQRPPDVLNVLNINEALDDDEIDFIDICTPNDSHRQIVMEALKYGKAMYCEKPLASNYKDALEMTTAVEIGKIKNTVALMYRYMPAMRLLKEAVKLKSIGDIIDFKIKLYHKTYLNMKKENSWRTKEQAGGGALMDLGVHLIDAVHFTLGEIRSVKCSTKVYFKDRTCVDEIAECKFALSNNIEGTMEVSRIFADREEPTTYVIYGTKGSITLKSNMPYEIEVYSFENNITTIKTRGETIDVLNFYPPQRRTLGFHQDCHMSSIIHAVNWMLENKADDIVPTFIDALKAQRVVEASYLSSAEDRTVLIEEII